MMHKKYAVAGVLGIIAIGFSLLLFKSGAGTPSTSLPKPLVVASFYPLYFFASQIAGDKAEVWNITPAGAEPHDYEPTAQDIASIERSVLLVLNGGELEAWGDKIKKNINPEETLILTVADDLTTEPIIEDGEKIIDPHVWLSPVLAEQIADKIEAALVRIDPHNASSYQSNAQLLKSKIDALDSEYRQGLAACKQKNIITAHASFGYLAKTYHLNQRAITGVSPDAEPSPKQLADLAKFARDNHVTTIFFERLVSPKLSETLATEVGAHTSVLNPIEGLSDDEIALGKDYFSEMRNNLINLTQALQCAP